MNLPGFPKNTAPKKIDVTGIPASIPASDAAVFASRIDRFSRELIENHSLAELNVFIRFGTGNVDKATAVAESAGKASIKAPPKYVCRNPLYSSEFLVVSPRVREQLDSAVQLLELHPLIFETWGLKEIEPSPRSALNFYGPPGTGKTLAAHVVASMTGRKIICASYADIESMYHGEGPKNVAELFRVAEEENAVLFIDEADSLLSKRLTNVTQGSEQAINSMRSQLLISLDNFKGLVIFATNLVSNYDSAFDTRVQHIHFPLPDRVARVELWQRHLPQRLPVREIDLEGLAVASEGLVGRDIKMAVISAAVDTARAGEPYISQARLIAALEAIKQSREQKNPI